MMDSLGEYVEARELDLDKILKFTNHLIDEFHEDPKSVDFFRGERYLRSMLIFLKKNDHISRDEMVKVKEGSIEDALFIILEKLIQNDYFLEPLSEIEHSTYSTSRTFAIHLYKNLGDIIGQEIKNFPSILDKVKTKLLTNQFKIDKEIEQETLEVVFILIRGDFLKNKDSYTALDDYLNLLGRKGILTQNELTEAISTNDIENTIEQIILKKLISTGKIDNPYIVNAFKKYSHAYTQSRREQTRNKVDEILKTDEGKDFQEDPLLLKLSTGTSILRHLNELGGELYDYDVDELVIIATEMGIINPNIAQGLTDLLNQDIGNKAQVIIEVFEYVFHSGYLDEIVMSDEEEREQIKSHYQDVMYSLNMLYKG